MILKGLTAFFLITTAALAALTPLSAPLDTEALKFSEEDLLIQKKVLSEKRNKVAAKAKQQSVVFLKLQKTNSNTGLFFDDPEEIEQKRKFSKRFSENNLKLTLKIIERLDEQIQGIDAELEWTKWQMARALGLKEPLEATTQPTETAFKCLDFPLRMEEAVDVKLEQDFGLREDKETGLKWHSMGWWMESPGFYAQACAAGTVVFSGPVTGRGHVVMIEHRPGLISVYANLSRDRVRIPGVGAKVSPRTLLGLAQGRFYFEVRNHSAAIHPKKVMNAALLSRLKF